MTDRVGRAELLWVASGQMLTLLLGIATLKVLTYLLGPQDYGRFALGLTIAGTLNLFVYGPMSHAVARYFHLCTDQGKPDELNRLVAYLLRASALAIFALGAVVVLLTIACADASWGVLVAVALVYGIASGTLSILLADMNTRRQRRAYALLQSADALMRLAGAVLLSLAMGMTGAAAMAGFLLGSLAALVIARFSLKAGWPAGGDVKGLFDPGAVGRGFGKYALSISLFALPAIFSSYGDRWIIQQALTETHVGIYVALAQIANAPANLVLAVFSQTLNPVIFQRAGNTSSDAAMRGSRRLLYRALLLLGALLAVVTGVSYVFGEWIVMTMTSPEFAPYAGLLWLLVLAAAIFQVGQALASEAFLYNQPFLLFLPKLVHAVIFLGLSLWLVASRQLEAIVIAAVAAAAVYLPLVMATNARAAKARGLTSAPAAGLCS